MSEIDISVRFFASLREDIGCAQTECRLPEHSGLDALLRLLSDRFGDNAAALSAENVRVAVNQELIAPGHRLQPGDEVAFLPPVTGG